MAVTKGVWGIDIGQCGLKALRLEMIDGKPTATAFDYVEHPKILSQPDADPDTLIREALDKFLSRNQVKTDEVAVGIAGQSGLARFVKLPPVEQKKIAEIVKFEAKQQIPFPLDEVVWDFQKIAGGEAVDGFALETEIGLFAMKRDVISRYLGYFTGSKIEVHTVQMSPLALVNFATYELLKKGGPPPEPGEEDQPEDDAPKNKKRCAVVMDIGTDASNLIITDGGKIIWQRPIPLGGNHFTRALTKELKLTFAKAEHLKKNAAKSPEMANILKAIKPVLTDFVGEVQRSLGYFTNTHRDAHVAYLVGLGSAFKLPGLQKYLGDKLSLDVRKPARFARLAGDAVLNDPLFQENILTFPVAYGLALQGLGQARLSTNLLPPEIRMDRVIRAKKPYAVAAAAALLIGTAGLAAGFSSNLKSVQDKSIEDGIKATQTAATAYSGQETQFNQKVSESEEKQKEVKTIIAGLDERYNWLRLFEVATDAMPRAGMRLQDLLGDPARAGSGYIFQTPDRIEKEAAWVWARLQAQKPPGLTREDWEKQLRAKPNPVPSDLLARPHYLSEAAWKQVLAQQPELWKLLLLQDRTGNLDPAVWPGKPGAPKDEVAILENTTALQWFEQRMASGVRIEDTLADAMSKHPQHLAMVNIEAVQTRWVLDPAAFLAAADDDVFKSSKRNIAEDTTPMKNDEREYDDTKKRYKPKWTADAGQTVPGAWVVEIRGYTDKADGEQFVRKALIENLRRFDQFVRDEGKIGKYIAGVPDPVKGRVSHAFVYGVWMLADAPPNTFAYINDSKLDRILGGGTGGFGGFGGPGEGGGGLTIAPGGPGTPGPGEGSEGGAAAAPAKIAVTWSGITAGGAAGAGGGFGGPGGPSPGTIGGSIGPRPGGEGGGPGPGAIGLGGGGLTGGAKDKEVKERRFEFVVMFIWREPNPSWTQPAPGTEASQGSSTGVGPGAGPGPGSPATGGSRGGP